MPLWGEANHRLCRWVPIHIVNKGADVWILGHKTESAGILIEATGNSNTEVCGAFAYTVGGENISNPMYRIVDSRLSATVAGAHYSSKYPTYHVLVEETLNGETREVLRSEVPNRRGMGLMTLFSTQSQSSVLSFPRKRYSCPNPHDGITMQPRNFIPVSINASGRVLPDIPFVSSRFLVRYNEKNDVKKLCVLR